MTTVFRHVLRTDGSNYDTQKQNEFSMVSRRLCCVWGRGHIVVSCAQTLRTRRERTCRGSWSSSTASWTRKHVQSKRGGSSSTTATVSTRCPVSNENISLIYVKFVELKFVLSPQHYANLLQSPLDVLFLFNIIQNEKPAWIYFK